MMIQITGANVWIGTLEKQSISEIWGHKIIEKIFGHQAKLQNSASMKISRNNMLIKGPVPLFGLARKVQPDALYILLFFVYLRSYVFTCIRSSKNLLVGYIVEFH